MNAWNGLIKKEFQLGLPMIYLSLAFILGWLTFGAFLQWSLDGPVLLYGFSVAALSMHIFYLPIYIMMSVNRERGRMHLWLHSPHSGHALLLAKVANGLFAMLLSLTVTACVSIFAYRSAQPVIQEVVGIQFNDLFALGVLFITQILFASLYFTIWGVFLWVLNLVLKSVVGQFSWMILFILILVGLTLLTKWESSNLFIMLTQWGSVSTDMFEVTFTFGDSKFYVDAGRTDLLYIGNIVYYAFLSLVVFLTSGWLLGRKVEV